MKATMISVCALAGAASSAQALTYGYTEVSVPYSGWTITALTAVSRHGTYFITEDQSPHGVSHYLLYGPNSTTSFVDLSGSAGPYGPNTGGELWPNAFTFVNDKGISITYDNANGTYALYDHETHGLHDLPSGLTPQAFNNRNNVGGAYTFTNIWGVVENWPVARYDFQTGAVKTINVGAQTGWGSVGGVTTDLSDTDEQVGNSQWTFIGDYVNFGWGYLVGPPVPLVYGSEAFWPFAGWTVVNAINDNHTVTGGGYFWFNGYEAFTGDFAGQNCSFLPVQTPQYVPIGQYIDNENRVLGTDQSGHYYLWASGTQYYLDQVAGQLPGNNPGVRMDVTGNIYGTYNDANNALHLFILMPPASG